MELFPDFEVATWYVSCPQAFRARRSRLSVRSIRRRLDLEQHGAVGGIPNRLTEWKGPPTSLEQPIFRIPGITAQMED